MLTLLLLAQLAQSLPRPQGPLFHDGRSGSSARAFFEFAPLDGAGVGAACACTAPTGAQGETMTFTRTSSAACSKKGFANTGISDGDVVTCTANQPRVEPDADGVLGVLKELSVTEYLKQTESIDNAVWASGASGAAAPTITADATSHTPFANYVSLPERIQIPAVSGAGAYSVRYQSFTGTAAAWTATCYFWGVSASSATYLQLTPGGTYISAPCAVPAPGDWSRCQVTGTLTSATWYLQIGTDLRDGTQSATGAVDAYVTGCNVTPTDTPVNYVAATSGSVTMTGDFPSFGGSWPSNPSSASFYLTAQTTSIWSSGGTIRPFAVGTGTGNYSDLESFGSLLVASSTTSLNTALSMTSPAFASGKIAGAWDGTNYKGCRSGSCAQAAKSHAGINATNSTIYVGYFTGTDGVPGIYSRICVDPDPTRCTP